MAGSHACADDTRLRDAVRNTVQITVLNDGSVVDRGVGLFLGSYEGKALLLSAAHVLGDLMEIGKRGSAYALEVRLSGNLLNVGYGEISTRLQKTALPDAVQLDYVIVEVPIPIEMRAAIVNLTAEHFGRPDRNQRVLIFGDKPGGGFGTNSGQLMGRSGTDVVTFQIKTAMAIEKEESGSPIVGADNQILGVLTGSDGVNGYGVYPESELKAAFSTIAWSKGNRKDYHGISVAVVPTFQYGAVTQDLGGGTSHTATDKGYYSSLEFEYFRLKRAPGQYSSPKLGLILGYSNGDAHGIGQVDNAEYTVKWGAVYGEIDRRKNDLGQLGLFILSHRVNGEFVHRLGVSLELNWQFLVHEDSAMDLGGRFEINDIGGSSGATHSSFGFGLVLRYSWLRAL